MDAIPESIRKEFASIVARGNEQEAKDFLIKNLKSFPQSAQDEIIAAFFEEALVNKNDELHAIADFRKQGMDAIDELEKGKRTLEDKGKLLDIKNSIQ